MFENAFWLYLITRLDTVHAVSMVLSMVFAVGLCTTSIALFSFRADGDDEGSAKLYPLHKWVSIIFAVSLMPAVLTPTQKDVLFIAASVGVLEAAKTDQARAIASKSIAVIEKYLDEVLKESTKK